MVAAAHGTPAPPRPLPAFAALSPRQRQVCDQIIAGKTDKEIAADMGLAVQTVKNHAMAIYAKLGISDPHNGRAGQGRIGLTRLWLDEARTKARNGGYATGYRHGYVDGLEKGRKEGKQAVQTDLERRCSACPRH